MARQRESKLSGMILDALRERGAFCFKVHGSEMMMAGLPDLMVCWRGKFVALEVKMPENRGGLSRIQQHRRDQIRAAGGVCEVVCSVNEALAIVDRIAIVDHRVD